MDGTDLLAEQSLAKVRDDNSVGCDGLEPWRFLPWTRPHLFHEFLEHIGQLLITHQAWEIDLHTAVIEKNLAANGGWHQ
jgi:hypothetical protein